MMLPDRSGIDLLPDLKGVLGDAPIVVVTAFHDMATTIRAMKAGAFDYLHKPFSYPAELDLVVSRALQARRSGGGPPAPPRRPPPRGWAMWSARAR